MSGKARFVLETNVLISALTLSRSKPRLAWNRARRTGVFCANRRRTARSEPGILEACEQLAAAWTRP
jgi:hypothetical protein